MMAKIKAESNFKPAGHTRKGAGYYVGKILINIVLWVFSLSCIFPLIWMFSLLDNI